MDAQIAAAVAKCTLAYYNFVHIYHTKKTKQKRRTRRCWMVAEHRKRSRRTMEKQFLELTSQPSGEFDNFHRMSLNDFSYLLSKVEPFIRKQDTHLREAIPAKIRLSITLRFLASGESYRSMHHLFKISSQLISKIVVDVCKALNEALKDEIRMPENKQQWLEVANGFKDNFPHALGVLDGKHIVVQSPVNSGSDFNGKKTFSLVLLALVDSNYNILYADIGSQEMISDEGVLKNSTLWEKIISNSLHLPTPCALPGTDNIDIPYVFLADGAFPLHDNIMKPYPGNHDINSPKRLFNMRLSKSRAVIDNVFGILSSKFRIFRKAIDLNIYNIPVITMTCLLLHNFLIKSDKSSRIYTPPGTVDTYNNGVLLQPGSWRRDVDENCALRDMTQVPCRSPLSAVQIRNHFTNYFNRSCTRV